MTGNSILEEQNRDFLWAVVYRGSAINDVGLACT